MESSSTCTTRDASSSSTVEHTISKETVTAATTTATTFAKGEASRFASGKLLIALPIFAIPSGPMLTTAGAHAITTRTTRTHFGRRAEKRVSRDRKVRRESRQNVAKREREKDRGSLRSGGLLINRARNTPRSPPPPWKNWRRWEYGAVLRRFEVFKGG